METDLTFKTEIFINTPINKVWEALTDPNLTKEYMYGCEALSDWKVGSKLDWRGAGDGVIYVSGYVQKYEPNQKLGFSVFDPTGKYEDAPHNYLSTEYSLSESNGKTHVKVMQTGYSNADEGEKRFNDSAAGWDMVLQGLKKLLEN